MQVKHRYPALVEDVTIEPLEERPGSVAISGRLRAMALVLDPGAFWVARAFDGTRTCAQIAEKLSRDGLHLGSEAFVEGIAEYLSDAEIVEFFDTPKLAATGAAWLADAEVREPLLHRCTGCGRSCQGHWVGPLDRAFLDNLDETHAKMAEVYPDLVGVEPIETVDFRDREVAALTLRGEDRRCIYLGEDNLCRIHTTLGSAAKPLICRMFPYTIVMTESGLRIGISPRCYTFEQTWKETTPGDVMTMTGVSAKELPAPLLRVVLDDPTLLVDPLERSTPLFHFLDQEKELLTLLESDDANFSSLLGLCCELLEGEETKAVDLDAFAHAILPHLARLGRALLDDDRAASTVAPEGSHGAWVRAYAAWLETLEAREVRELDPETRAWAMYVFGQWVWIRDWSDMETWALGVLVVLIGMIVASWYTEDHPEREGTFGHALTVWMRGMGALINVTRLFASGEEVGRVMRVAMGANASEEG